MVPLSEYPLRLTELLSFDKRNVILYPLPLSSVKFLVAHRKHASFSPGFSKVSKRVTQKEAILFSLCGIVYYTPYGIIEQND
jgi:hypothetical protein